MSDDWSPDKDRILVLNLPASSPVMRRYNCTYRSTGYLYPPHELLRAATLLKKVSSMKVSFIDAISEKKSISDIERYIRRENIGGLIYLSGLENIPEELGIVRRLKAGFPGIKIAGIGFYLKKFREDFRILDAALDGTFESRIKRALNQKGELFANLRENESLTENYDPDIIEGADRTLLNEASYRDNFIRGRTAWLFTAFGCPYGCSYCIKTYDSDRWLPRDTAKVIKEIEKLAYEGYKNIRFLDDNITLNKQFLYSLREYNRNTGIRLNLYGFSRADLIDRETVSLLKDLNFKRIYIGVESFCRKKQNEYGKLLDTSEKMKKAFSLLSDAAIETAAWIIYDPSTDALLSLPTSAWRLSRMGVSMVLMNVLVPYKGTELYESKYGGKVSSEYAIRLAGPLRGAFAGMLFYLSYALYYPNWITLLKYLFRFPGSFIASAFYNYPNSIGVFSIPGRIPKRVKDENSSN